MNRVGRVNQPVQRFLGLRPLAIHPQEHDQRVRRRDVDQVGHALHVRLPGEHPEVADEDAADRLALARVLALNVDRHRVGAAGRHADELTVLVSHLLRADLVREDCRRDRLDVLLFDIGIDRNICPAVSTALIDARFDRFLDLDPVLTGGRDLTSRACGCDQDHDQPDRKPARSMQWPHRRRLPLDSSSRTSDSSIDQSALMVMSTRARRKVLGAGRSLIVSRRVQRVRWRA